MRIAKVLQTLLGITGIVVDCAEVGSEGVIFDVRPRRKKPRCSGCGKRAPGYDQRKARSWRHLNVGATRVWLRLRAAAGGLPSVRRRERTGSVGSGE